MPALRQRHQGLSPCTHLRAFGAGVGFFVSCCIEGRRRSNNDLRLACVYLLRWCTDIVGAGFIPSSCCSLIPVTCHRDEHHPPACYDITPPLVRRFLIAPAIRPLHRGPASLAPLCKGSCQPQAACGIAAAPSTKNFAPKKRRPLLFHPLI